MLAWPRRRDTLAIDTPAVVAEIAAKVGFEGLSLKKTLDELVAERKIQRTGKARGTKYKLA